MAYTTLSAQRLIPAAERAAQALAATDPNRNAVLVILHLANAAHSEDPTAKLTLTGEEFQLIATSW